MSSFAELLKQAKPGAVAPPRLRGERSAKRDVPRFSRQDDDEQMFESSRVPKDVERIALEDQTLTGGIPTEAVVHAVDSGLADDAVVAEVAAQYGSRKELLDCPEFREGPLYWDIHGTVEE